MTDTEMPGKGTRIRAAACILNGKDEVLLVRHSKEGKEYWLFPGGGVEPGESLRTTVAREVEEEVALTVEVGDLLFVSESISPTSGRHVVHATFLAELRGEQTPSCGGDPRVTEWTWQAIPALPHIQFLPCVGSQLAAGWNGSRFEIPSFLASQWEDLR